MSHPVEMVMALVSGGAHLDFRTKKGLTPLHTAAQKGNEEALRVSMVFDPSIQCSRLLQGVPLVDPVRQNLSSSCVCVQLMRVFGTNLSF